MFFSAAWQIELLPRVWRPVTRCKFQRKAVFSESIRSALTEQIIQSIVHQPLTASQWLSWQAAMLHRTARITSSSYIVVYETNDRLLLMTSCMRAFDWYRNQWPWWPWMASSHPVLKYMRFGAHHENLNEDRPHTISDKDVAQWRWFLAI